MPAADDAKTKSAPKGRQTGVRPRLAWLAAHKRSLYYAVGSALALFALLAPTLFYQPAEAVLKTGGTAVHLEIAASQAAQQKGLSGRATMPGNQGMLFVFAKPAATCFWMKGMRFALDIIWLNSHKQVVYMQQNVSPQTYPKIFCPTTPAKYVIELNAGQAKMFGLHEGQTLHF